MSSIQERLQMKREPLDQWSIREKLCLAFAVARSGDQNWMSVSRALKPFGEPNRPADWFHQKNCAAQYGALLSMVETPKRKKRTSGVDGGIETPAECILRKLRAERQAELKKLMAEEKAEYLKLQEDLALLQSGNVTEEQLDIWCKEIEEEERRKEQENAAYAQWLKERELRKQEIERAWRPVKSVGIIGQKRKNPDSSLEGAEIENEAEETPGASSSNKPALSPLLTSLLKSPSQNTSILHSAITNQRQNSNTATNPTIASLLSTNQSGNLSVSPGIQQLVTSAISQEPQPAVTEQNQPLQDILDDPNLPHLKIDDLANSILVQDGPLPEIKKEEVDDIISEIIENAQDIVDDPEQHLQLDGNGDISLLAEFGEEEDVPPEEPPAPAPAPPPPIVEKPPSPLPPPPQVEEKIEPEKKKEEKVQEEKPPLDPFEFQEDPVIFEPQKNKIVPKTTISEHKEPEKILKVILEEKPDILLEKKIEEAKNVSEETIKEEPIAKEVEKVEVKAEKEEMESKIVVDDSSSSEDKPLSEITEKKPEINLDVTETVNPDAINTEYVDELYDDVNMEIKVDKSGKYKRDYSRTSKKKEEKNFESLLSIENVVNDSDEVEEFDEKKDSKKIKSENERSSSPWTEEDELRSKRRQSTPATPIDSVPNSPASSVGALYDDDREHRNWKKSVMLVYNRLATHKYASLFLKPITDDQAPGYSHLIYRPMDLQTIKKNIESGVLRTTLEFKRDIMLMFTNAIMYNKTNGTVYNMAKQMQQECLQPIEILMQAQSQEGAPARRETRTSESGVKRKRTMTGSEENIKKKRKDD